MFLPSLLREVEVENRVVIDVGCASFGHCIDDVRIIALLIDFLEVVSFSVFGELILAFLFRINVSYEKLNFWACVVVWIAVVAVHVVEMESCDSSSLVPGSSVVLTEVFVWKFDV